MYDLILTGPSRCATTSLWGCLDSHSKISSSLIKEPLVRLSLREYADEYFEKFYNPKSDTQYLLDGCPIDIHLNVSETIIHLKSFNFRSIKYISLLRDLQYRALSKASLLTKLYCRNKLDYKPQFLDNDDLLVNTIFVDWMIQSIKLPYQNLIEIDDLIPREDIFVGNLNDNNFKFYITKILEFLQLENENIKTRHSNKLSNISVTMEYLNIKKRMLKIYKENVDSFKDLSDKYYKKIEKEFGVII